MAGCVTTDDNVYVVGIDGEYPPYSYIDENGKAVGFDVESIQWIAEQKGFEVDNEAQNKTVYKQQEL